MSILESDARPVIGALMSDIAIPLDRERQLLIARWSIKTSMVFECTNPTKQWFYSDPERQEFAADDAIPVGTFVWLGRFHRSGLTFTEGNRLMKSPPLLRGGNVTTLGLGRLVIQVLTVRAEPEAPRRLLLHAWTAPADLVQIWPTQASVQWPPATTFTEAGLDELSRRFTNPP